MTCYETIILKKNKTKLVLAQQLSDRPTEQNRAQIQAFYICQRDKDDVIEVSEMRNDSVNDKE